MQTRGRHEAHVAPNFCVQVALDDAHTRRRTQLRAAHFARVANQRNLVVLNDLPIFCRARLVLHAQQPPGDGAAAGAHFQARAAQRAQKLYQRRLLAQRQPQPAQPSRQRLFRIVIDAGDAPTAQIQHGERLQHVVELPAVKIDAQTSAAAHAAQVLKVANTILVEHHPAHR